MIDFYETLEVNPKASPEVIRDVYQFLLQHYDLNNSSNDPEKNQQLKAINLAYDVLSDPEKRKAYDLELNHARNANDEFSGTHKAKNTVNPSRVSTTQVRNTRGQKMEVLDNSSVLYRIKWNRWGWAVSILVVIIILISMVQPDSEKALRGQKAVELEAERERKVLKIELKKPITEEQKTDSVEHKEKKSAT